MSYFLILSTDRQTDKGENITSLADAICLVSQMVAVEAKLRQCAGLDQRSYSTSSPVSAGMGDRLRA